MNHQKNADTIGKYIKIERIKLGMDQKDLIKAMKYKVTLPRLSLIENDHVQNIGHNRLLSILNALKDKGADPIDIYGLKY